MNHTHSSRFFLGAMAREKISTIEGRVVGICFYETGCTHIGIKQIGLTKDGKPFDMLWFDEPNVDLIGDDPSLKPNSSEKPGGPLPTGMSYPGGR